MKLENQFFQFFFKPFIIGVIFSSIIVIVCSVIFTGDYLEQITGNNIIGLGKNYSKINIDAVNKIISSNLLKMQLGLNELILYYLNIARQLKTNNPNTNRNIDDNYLKCVLDFDENINKTNINTSYMAYWFLDLETNLSKLKPNSFEENQLITLSNMIPNFFSVFYATNSTFLNIYLYFEGTELYFSYPLIYNLKTGSIAKITNFTTNPVWCTDEKGEILKYYKTRCRGFYSNIKKAKSDIFDINYKDNINRTIFVTEFYSQVSSELELVFSICIEFVDPFTDKLAYICSDVLSNDINTHLDHFNSKISGYFFVNPVGFSKSFYFPNKLEDALTMSENIYERDKKYFLEEKTYFNNNIQRLMTSNYIKYINDSLYTEIFTNGKNRNEQIFYIDGQKFEFSIYPIILENYEGNKEHVLNIIYVYNDHLFYDEVKLKTDLGTKILLELVIIIIFGTGLLYLVVLSLNVLAKYIVIPIKNVNYMLKGINIGGINRLKYLKYLKTKQDENGEMLEKLNIKENEKNNKDKNNNDESTNNKKEEKIEDAPLIDDKEDINQDNENNNLEDNEYNDEVINSNVNNYEKYEEENEFIEKETTFYNFDEQLLQYRPLEINRLVSVLIDLKRALSLTSSEQQTGQIINYSDSEEIFRSFNNKEGLSICQSNIGNLQSQLLKYDKAIYHLATSLQDNKLKKFLSQTLSDEFDESDSLLNKIYMAFNNKKSKKHKKNNILIEKQLNNVKTNFSQKIIGILINSRYNKLIHVYYNFFSLIKKLDSKALNGQFINTSFHNINYYHKIIIQYIYLCFMKNDLVKIGESILDYIEFLIKFKFKISFENKYLFDIRNKRLLGIGKKLIHKKNAFDKILNWFNLFDEYSYHVKNNTSLSDEKSLIEDFNNISSDNNDELNSGSQSVFLFKVNLQRAEYLRGKFSLLCNNYTDALFFFIRAAKKDSIISDGLIKKKSLKRISKILLLMTNKYNDYEIIHWKMKEKIKEYEKTKLRHFFKKHTQSTNINNIQETKLLNDKNSFNKELILIKNDIKNDLIECNAKQTKDVIIIIDFNLYNQNDNNNLDSNKIDSFIEQTRTILDNYLSNNDKLAVFIYKFQYKIVCPLLEKNKIDSESFLNDLIYYKKNIFKEIKEEEDSYIDEIKENVLSKKQKFSGSESNGSNESYFSKDTITNIEQSIKGLIYTINYSKNYLKIKEDNINEKYMILFTDIFNTYKISDEIISTNFDNLNKGKDITFLLVGKHKENIEINNNKNSLFNSDEEIRISQILNEKYGEKSESIDFENMKKLKNFLSSNNVIKDEIIYPNEIYK